MILKLKKLSKKINEQILIKNFTFEFKESGFYIILGESGCGKTTLLNILSLIDTNYEGLYLINDNDAFRYKEVEKCSLRSNKFSYIFQNFNLFDDDTVFNNIMLMLDSISELTKDFKINKVTEVIKLLDLEKIRNEYVRNLSGGEKQRVAIGRAIITSPEVIFCDEPTGSLDTINTENIFNILRNISLNTTVICVTHDKENAIKYADTILEFKNKEIKVIKNQPKKKKEKLKLMNLLSKKKTSTLRFKYIFNYVYSKLKIRKVRNVIKSIFLSISLISSGLSLGLSTGLHTSLVDSFKSVLDQNLVVLNKKDCKNTIFDFYSSSINDVASLLNKYKDDLDYFGTNYLVDFENFFPNGNDLYLTQTGKLKRIEGFNIRMFNEFIVIRDFSRYEIYPTQTEDLKDDEIIMSFNYEQMKNICMELRIEKTFDSLARYIKTHNLLVTLRVQNDSWQYNDEQLFKVKGVILDSSNRIYHTNPLFNNVLFEEKMRFPVSNRLNKVEDYPWIFKKVYYVHTKKFQTYFLNKVFYDEDYQNFLFDSDNSTYSPLTCAYDTQVTNKLFVYNVFKDTIDINMIKNLDDIDFKYENYYFSTNQGYFNNGTSLFSGFSKPVFFSLDSQKLDFIIDAHSKVAEDEYLNIKVPENVVDGYAFKPSSDNLKFKSTQIELLPNEIFVSEGFRKILGVDDVINKEVFVTLLTNSASVDNEIRNTFKTIKLVIKGVEKRDNNVAIYQNNDFSISLFRDLFKISSFSLIPTSIIFETNNKLDQKDIDYINSFFSDYELTNPILTIEQSIEDSMLFLKYLLFGFSVLSIISSFIFLVIISIVNAIESKKDISIFCILGFNKFQILKIFIFDNLFYSLISFITSSISLIFISMTIENVLSKTYGISSFNIANPIYFAFNVIILLIVSVLSALTILRVIRNLKIEKHLH